LQVKIIFFLFIFLLGVANELHDSYSVKVTEWEKFKVLVRAFRDKKYQSGAGVKHEQIVKNLVLFYFIIFLLY